jgi:periplasmic protein TonB
VISKVTAGVTGKRGKRDHVNYVLDARGPRVLVCMLAAIAIWVGFSVGFVRGLWNAGDKASVTKPTALDMRLVSLPPPEPPREPPQKQQASQQMSARAGEATTRVTPTPAAPAVQTKPARTARRSAAPTPATPPTQTHDASHPAAAPVTTPPVIEGNERAQTVTPPTPPAAANTNTTTPAASAHLNASAPQSNSAATSAASADSAKDGSSTSAGNGPAHAILQPLPSLPDDLREDAFQAVATARFSVHRDGSVDVELIKPTHNPRLNQLLLDALKKWRFFPAMKNGEAVESTQDIRVHFNVD